MQVGKVLIIIGSVLIVLGLLWILMQKIGLQPGKLPGDIVWQRGNVTIYIPLATGLFLSILLTLLFRLFK